MPNSRKSCTDHRAAPVSPATLDVNRRGGWKQVIGLDAADASALASVQRAALNLCRVGGGSWRISSADVLPQPLYYLNDAGRGWEPAPIRSAS